MTQPIRALLFDVFGTVVDWRGSIIREGERLNQKHSWQIDWAAFADAWRAGYQPAMEQVRSGARPWVNLDTLNREILERLLAEVGLELGNIQKAHLNRVWHRLLPWPDSIGGLHQLKAHAVIASLSNGHVALLTNMAKHAGLPWDCVLSAELAKHYKPQPEAYLTAARLLDLSPEQVMMVAAHENDLQAARSNGLKTAFVYRPLEYGPERTITKPADDAYDIVVDNFYDLAHDFTVRFV
ncbi:MAG: haloacid dehalogenase type II [Deinococcota bacterium]